MMAKKSHSMKIDWSEKSYEKLNSDRHLDIFKRQKSNQSGFFFPFTLDEKQSDFELP